MVQLGDRGLMMKDALVGQVFVLRDSVYPLLEGRVPISRGSAGLASADEICCIKEEGHRFSEPLSFS